MDANLPDNQIHDLTALDLRAMDVIGWDLVVYGDYDASGDVELGDLNLVLFNWNVDGGVLTTEWINQRPTAGMPVGLAELNGVLFNWGEFGVACHRT